MDKPSLLNVRCTSNVLSLLNNHMMVNHSLNDGNLNMFKKLYGISNKTYIPKGTDT